MISIEILKKNATNSRIKKVEVFKFYLNLFIIKYYCYLIKFRS